MARSKRVQNKTVCVMGEGVDDKGFVEHLKSIYSAKGISIKVRAASGGCPKDVIKELISHTRNAVYDVRLVLIDSDVPITQQERDLAKKNKITILVSEPNCLEGMLLEVLSQKAGHCSQSCKNKFSRYLTGKASEPESYRKNFTKEVLDNSKKCPVVHLRSVFSKK